MKFRPYDAHRANLEFAARTLKTSANGLRHSIRVLGLASARPNNMITAVLDGDRRLFRLGAASDKRRPERCH
jgi:hypothetical protein